MLKQHCVSLSVTGLVHTLWALWCGMDKESRGRTVSLTLNRAVFYSLQCISIYLCIHARSSCCRVNLALAYTELTEELGRVRNLAVKQSDLLRHVSQEPGRSPEWLLGWCIRMIGTILEYYWAKTPKCLSFSLLPQVSRPPPAPQRLSPTSPQRPSLSPDRLLPTTSPPLSPNDGPASYSHQPTSSRLRAKFQGRRSYSEVRLDFWYNSVWRFDMLVNILSNITIKLRIYIMTVVLTSRFFPGIWPVSHPETIGSPDERSSIHPP